VLALVLGRCCTATITTHPRRLSAPLALRAISAAAVKRDLIKKAAAGDDSAGSVVERDGVYSVRVSTNVSESEIFTCHAGSSRRYIDCVRRSRSWVKVLGHRMKNVAEVVGATSGDG